MKPAEGPGRWDVGGGLIAKRATLRAGYESERLEVAGQLREGERDARADARDLGQCSGCGVR